MTTSSVGIPEQKSPGHALAQTRAWLWLVVAIYVVIVGAGLVLRLMTFERFLPVLDHYDESLRFLHGYQLRPNAPLADAYWNVEWETGFPPVQPWLAANVQRVVEWVVPFPTPADYIYAMRLVSVAGGTITAGLLIGVGWYMMRPLGRIPAAITGGLTGMLWAFSPQIVETGNFALIDPLIYPTLAAALLASVYAIHRKLAWAAFLSLAFVVLAIYEKYILIYALWLPAGAVLVLIRQRGWRKMLPWLGVMAVFSAATAYWLLVVHQALALSNTEANSFRENGLTNMLSPLRNWDNLSFTISQTMGSWLFWLIIVGGIAAYGFNRRRDLPVVNLRWLWLLLPPALGCLMLTSSVNVISQTDPYWHRIRYTLPVMMMLAPVWAMAVAQIVQAWRGHSGIQNLIVAIIALGFAFPAIDENMDQAAYFDRPHTLERVWSWSDASLPNPEGKIMMSAGSDIATAWNRPWSGYNGSTTFEWVFDADPALGTPAGFVDQGVAYFAATDADLSSIYSDDAAFVGQLFPLKTIGPGPVGAFTLNFYRMQPPQITADVTFGEQITLVGVDVSASSAAPGDTVTLRPFWQAEAVPTTNYSMFVHLLPPGSTTPIAQYDGAPAAPERLPVTWEDPDEVLVGDAAVLTIPADAAPGDYTLAIGLYDFNTGERLAMPDGETAYTIPLTVATP